MGHIIPMNTAAHARFLATATPRAMVEDALIYQGILARCVGSLRAARARTSGDAAPLIDAAIASVLNGVHGRAAENARAAHAAAVTRDAAIRAALAALTPAEASDDLGFADL